jgi:hypothetical protein
VTEDPFVDYYDRLLSIRGVESTGGDATSPDDGNRTLEDGVRPS